MNLRYATYLIYIVGELGNLGISGSLCSKINLRLVSVYINKMEMETDTSNAKDIAEIKLKYN